MKCWVCLVLGIVIGIALLTALALCHAAADDRE